MREVGDLEYEFERAHMETIGLSSIKNQAGANLDFKQVYRGLNFGDFRVFLVFIGFIKQKTYFDVVWERLFYNAYNCSIKREGT